MNCHIPGINCDLLDIVAVKFIGKDLNWLFGVGCFSVYRTDGKRNVLILTHRAEVARSENGVLKDESKGDKITYNLTNSTAIIDGNKAKGPSGRISTVIAPRDSNMDAGKPLELQGSRRVSP